MKQKNASLLLFKRTRSRLASSYIAGISLVLGLVGFGVYEAIIHAHHITVDKELKTVAGTLHDSLEPILNIPGQLDDKVLQFFPDLCLIDSVCTTDKSLSRYRLGAIQKGQYYIHIFDLSGNLIALSRIQPEGLPRKKHQNKQEILYDSNGIRYLQQSYLLHNQRGQNWGYIQVGRSLEDFDTYLNLVALILLLGLPLTVVVIGISAWILTGLAMKPVIQSYHQIQQFTADAAHELRTPLAAIRATVESTLMTSTLVEAEVRNTLETLARQTQRLSTLVADLLMLSRLDCQLSTTSTTTLKQDKICLNDLISDLLEELAFLAVSSKILIKLQINVNDSIEIGGDIDKIYRLLFNLVINAIQYTPEGGQVTIILEQQNQFAVIKVQDTGIGIDSQELPHIFERFYRINKARSREKGGSGLGLSIAQAIAIAHRGTIKVRSEIGKGSLFTVHLPIGI
ncbi:histidine kinase [Rippkaea orientalis PCC 8801]|uniref:histidine kinase n=1 Tax=Rippkaea orientalis (strain PCC 8801 / RF-1) TaxID=41431 RepID=B7K1P7_RIPO1|nr:two-component system sensor histidine kinase RppB [Rippkaea orientalis]ACK67589.1 histidine kinase [Rippkaea orientalis PCC 8801]